MKIFGVEITFNTKQEQIKRALLRGGKEEAIKKYLELCKGHKLTHAIRFVDRMAAKTH